MSYLYGDKFCSYIKEHLWIIFLCIHTILQSALFFFNLTLSHEQFFISLNIDGGHHSKLFSSFSDRTAHHACNAVWRVGEMASEEMSKCFGASSSGWCCLGGKIETEIL